MNRRICFLLAIFIILLSITVTVQANERNDGGYFTIVDEGGQAVFYTGRKVEIGDECLTHENKRYEVVRIEGDIAYAKFKGEVNLSKYLPNGEHSTYHVAFLQGLLTPRIAEAQGSKIAIYHTHSDESYVPTDGKESINGTGGIFKVGEAFVKGLQAKGLEAVQSDKKHEPHDDMAYERSRRTALDMIKQLQPAAIFDIHRDAVPPKVYGTTINGQEVSKVQLVVGKYGPTAKQIEDYALKIKAASDSKHPGLVKGIFFAKGGSYNEDLHPRSMLLEVGAHTNSRESAERGVALFSDAIPAVLGQTAPGPSNTAGSTGMGNTQSGPSGASKSIGWLIGLLILGGGLFLYLSTGSLKEAGAKFKQFATTEFANFFGPKLKKKKEESEEDEDKM